MIRVDTTDFSTPAWTRRGLDPVTPGPMVRPWRRVWTCLLAGVLLWCLMLAAPAMAREPEVLQSTVQRSADGAKLSVRLDLEASPPVEDALLKGVPAESLQEVYDLAGTNYYNPNWGYLNGKKRNAVVGNTHQPTFILSKDWKINNKSSMMTSETSSVSCTASVEKRI